MVFNNRIKEVQKIVYNGFKVFFDSIAGFLGYPDSPGMPIFPLDLKAREQLTGQDLLPKHITEIPPNQAQRPETLTEALFGTFPYTMPIEKHFSECYSPLFGVSNKKQFLSFKNSQLVSTYFF